MKSKNNYSLRVPLDDDQEQALKELAELQDRPITNIVREAIWLEIERRLPGRAPMRIQQMLTEEHLRVAEPGGRYVSSSPQTKKRGRKK